MLDVLDWPATDIQAAASEIARFGLEREAYELEAFGLTVVPAERTGAAETCRRGFEAVCLVAPEDFAERAQCRALALAVVRQRRQIALHRARRPVRRNQLPLAPREAGLRFRRDEKQTADSESDGVGAGRA